MQLRLLPQNLSVARYDVLPKTPMGFYSLSCTEDEISLVAETERLPLGYTHREDGWRAFCVVGDLDFSLVGVLSSISTALAEGGVSIFALSTYNTDYILVKEERLAAARDALTKKGYIII